MSSTIDSLARDRADSTAQKHAHSGQPLAAHMRRRTFAIISHPDAGKTTLTEKLLSESGAIQIAGQVRERGERRRTRSDWMEVEQKRGISIASSVMTFEHDGLTFNLLDTPGHADFSEDTFRTLTAVDSAIMVLDAAKGIESQTRKLFEVCRLRDIPIITFINKVDREARNPLDLLDEIMETLALDTTPMVWPIGTGVDFQGMVDVVDGSFIDAAGQREPGKFAEPGSLEAAFGQSQNQAVSSAVEGLELARESLPGFDIEAFRAGHLTPVYFGSALKSLGIGPLLRAVADFAPSPRPQPALPDPVLPESEAFTGFVFKVQANMDPKHRDRVAFLRIASGTLTRGMKVRNTRSGKDQNLVNPMFFLARDRDIADTAVAGDIVGIPNHGTLSVGDTLSELPDVKITGIPNFAPEILRRVQLSDTTRAKQLAKALQDLAEEGVIQTFRPTSGSGWYIGAVGPLQLEVLVSRARAEYGVEIGVEASQFETARWLETSDKAALQKLTNEYRHNMAEDRAGAPVFLARNGFELNRSMKTHPDVKFSATRDRGLSTDG